MVLSLIFTPAIHFYLQPKKSPGLISAAEAMRASQKQLIQMKILVVEDEKACAGAPARLEEDSHAVSLAHRPLGAFSAQTPLRPCPPRCDLPG